jgi:hypothetical protein
MVSSNFLFEIIADLVKEERIARNKLRVANILPLGGAVSAWYKPLMKGELGTAFQSGSLSQSVSASSLVKLD